VKPRRMGAASKTEESLGQTSFDWKGWRSKNSSTISIQGEEENCGGKD